VRRDRPVLRRLGDGRLPRLPQRRLGGEQAPAAVRPQRARARQRQPALDPDGDPAARHRPLRRRHTRRRPPLRLDHAPADRPAPPPPRLYSPPIPRDRRVETPGYGAAKINPAYQVGGSRLAARTVAAYTDIPINHVVIVNFAEFKDLIDAVGGIDIVVSEPIQ